MVPTQLVNYTYFLQQLCPFFTQKLATVKFIVHRSTYKYINSTIIYLVSNLNYDLYKQNQPIISAFSLLIFTNARSQQTK